MQITTRSKSRNLPQKRKSEDDDTGPRPKVPRTTAPAPAPSSEPLTPQPDPHTTRSKTGKLPKKKAEEDIAPTAKALRMATSASDTKPAARVKLDPKLQPKTSTKAKPAPKASSKKQTPGPRTDTQSEDSENKTPAAQPKTTSRTKQPDRSGNLPHQNREPSAPRTGWERTRAQMSESPNDDNEEIKRAKANSRWHEPKVVDKMNLPPMPPKAKPLTRRSGTVLHILVYGNGDHGELGLGIHKHEGRLPTNVDTPQLNRRLRHDYPGVVDVACGRRHSIALTSDGRILTWGWNEYGILGRATDFDLDGPDLRGWEPGTADASHLRDVTWTQVVATDNACFALSDDGCVFGWGTFMQDGKVLGFSPSAAIQRTPTQIDGLTNITNLAAGSQHVLAIDSKCAIYAWGSGSHGQLGWRVPGPEARSCLRPRSVPRLPVRHAKAQHVACGSHSSFALDQHGWLYVWGGNEMAQLGIPERFGAEVAMPRRVKALERRRVIDVAGGLHHALACTDEGELFTWGSCGCGAVGLRRSDLDEENTVLDEDGTPLFVTRPTQVERLENIVAVGAGPFQSIAVDVEGVAYTFGRPTEWQTGQGTNNFIEDPRAVFSPDMDKTAVRFADAGEGFSVFAGVRKSNEAVVAQ